MTEYKRLVAVTFLIFLAIGIAILYFCSSNIENMTTQLNRAENNQAQSSNVDELRDEIESSRNRYAWYPVIAVIGYFLIGLTIIKFKEKSYGRDLGDNVYLLGFLFTLIAILMSTSGLDDTTRSWQVAIMQNGAALSSTIVGIVIRVFYIQMFSSADHESESEELAAELNKLRRHVKMVNAEFKDELGKFPNELKETMDMVTNNINNTLNRYPIALEKSIEKNEIEINKLKEDIISEAEKNN